MQNLLRLIKANESGKLEFDLRRWKCGTKHCLVGTDVALNRTGL